MLYVQNGAIDNEVPILHKIEITLTVLCEEFDNIELLIDLKSNLKEVLQ